MNRRQRLWPGLALLTPLLFLAGCSHSTPTDHASATTKPSPKATPFPLAVRVEGMESAITDREGRTIAKMSAKRSVLAPTKASSPGDPIGMLEGASAILYQNNKPVATLVADQMQADRDTRIVIGTGNVKIRSLQQVDTPTIRADKMTWRYNDNSIVGEGHVVLTRQPDLVLPGSRFTADTAIHRYTIYPSGAPATGTF